MRRALVTGASRGIGRAVVDMLLADGWSVLGVSRSRPEAMPGSPCFEWLSIDVGLPAEVDWLSWWLADPTDAVVHCAGIRGPRGPLVENDPAAWLDTIRTNLLGAYHVARVALPSLRASEDGRLLLFSGGGAFNASPGYSAYATAKGGVVALMETLAAECAGTSVTVNCVAPGYVPTTIHDDPVPDGGRALETAVACIRHLLAPAARGLNGKTISARWDDWAHLDARTVPTLNASPAGTRDRHPIAMLQRAARTA